MSDFDVDLFVIGAGSGGVRAARMASSYGAKTAIAEAYRLGGTCVIRGCVPKKLYVYASRFRSAFEDSKGFGWHHPSEPSFHWQELYKAQSAEIERLSGLYGRTLGNAQVEIHHERAQIIGPHTIKLMSSQKEITAKTILIATGGTPFMPSIKGIEHAINSDDFFLLEDQPKKALVVGGGYIAVEFASILHGLGSDVTLSYRGDKLLRGFDEDVRSELTNALQERGLNLRLKTNLMSIDLADNDQRRVTFVDGDLDTYDMVLFATGRSPALNGLGLETIGVTLNENGTVKVDPYSKTNIDYIYAVGDVTGRGNLTPVAIREGAAFAQTVFDDRPLVVDHSLIPTAVFTTPEVGTVGLSEEEARAKGKGIDVYTSHFTPMLNVLAKRLEKTFMKLIVERQTGRVLGAHMVGPDSGEIIQMAAIAIGMKATKDDFDRTMALHPSAGEEFVTMKVARGTQS